MRRTGHPVTTSESLSKNVDFASDKRAAAQRGRTTVCAYQELHA
jgi:hypothetical protein